MVTLRPLLSLLLAIALATAPAAFAHGPDAAPAATAASSAADCHGAGDDAPRLPQPSGQHDCCTEGDCDGPCAHASATLPPSGTRIAGALPATAVSPATLPTAPAPHDPPQLRPPIG